MYLSVNGERTYVATGGKAFDKNLPTVVFLHGSGLDHRSWALQTRWFAFHGYSVVAPDFPAHSLSEGEALDSIEAMAEWLWQLLDEMGVENCSLVGHSQGGLVALEAAATQPDKVKSLSLIGCAAVIAVNDHLLTTSQSDQPSAVDAMLIWGFGEAYQFGRSNIPGQAPIGIGWQIMCDNPLHADLRACQKYTNGEQASTQVTAPSQLILAKKDKMTPLKFGLGLGKSLPNCVSTTVLEVGHMIPMEAPEKCLTELQNFITSLD
ncbi:MAG: pimeloyl-ACP methyl ester carboxylesterase [Cocleimonas sp.]|jgi:pimeloyl-ACP methyl ester carboxylesterase